MKFKVGNLKIELYVDNSISIRKSYIECNEIEVSTEFDEELTITLDELKQVLKEIETRTENATT